MSERSIVPTPAGAFPLMRHLIAAHGWELEELVRLQDRHHWAPQELHEAEHNLGKGDHDHPQPSRRPRRSS